MKLAVIAGDGIGPEVIAEALKVLDVVLPGVERTEYDLGARRYHATGELLTEDTIEELRSHDAILLGAIGDPSVPSGVLERGLLLKLRFALDHHVNLRPGRLYAGVSSPLTGVSDIDFVVVREGTEGPYTGNGGALRVGTPHEVATEVSVNTAFGVERVVRDAFARAQTRRKHLTLVHKTNVLAFAGGLWSRIVAEVGKEYPRRRGRLPAHRRRDHPHGHRSRPLRRDRHRQPLRRHHHRSGRRGVRRHRPGRERQHRRDADQPVDVRARARQRARHRGQGIADPTAAVMSVALLLAHVGETEAAARVDKAVGEHLATRGDAKLSTSEVGERIVSLLG